MADHGFTTTAAKRMNPFDRSPAQQDCSTGRPDRSSQLAAGFGQPCWYQLIAL